MNSNFLNKYSENDVILFDTNRSISKNDLNTIYDSNYDFIKDRDLIIIICDNLLDIYALFLTAIVKGAIPILIDKNYNRSWFEKLIENYSPSYIFSAQKIIFPFNEKYSGSIQNNNIFCYSNPNLNNYSEKLFSLLTTSGSTGDPKLAMISKSNIIENTKAITAYLDLTNNDIACTTLPLNYSYGLSVFLTHLYVGGKIYITNKSILERDFWNDFKKYNISSFNGVPFQYELILKLKVNLNFSHLRYLTQAGGKLADDHILKINDECKKCNKKFFVMYGQTECSPRISYLHPEFIENKIGSAGKAVLNGKIDIVNKKGGEGEIIYSGPNVFLGYSQTNIDLTGNLTELLEWNTGDIGYIDDDGFLYITGRSKRFIKIEGKRFNLNNIEQEIFNSFNIKSYLIDIQNILIVVLSKEDITFSIDELHRYLFKSLGVGKKSIKIKLLDEIPLKSNNKIDYNGIIERL